MTQARKAFFAVAALTSLLGGCLTKVTVVDGDAGMSPGSSHPAADGGTAPPVSCSRGGYCSAIDVASVDTLDLLFVVDNSASMGDEQAALAAAISPLTAALESGTFGPDDPPRPGVKDMHVGVVSSDLGVSGIEGVAGCSSGGGDDARLQHEPHGMRCDALYPPFLSYLGNELAGPLTEPSKFADDVACIAQLGTKGCGYGQPLEAALKALWPAVDTDANGAVVNPNPIRFLATSQSGMLGLGDIPQAQGGNLGFLRRDPELGPTLLSIVVVSDDDDCSMRTSDPFGPDASDPDVNLRCFRHQDALFEASRRYTLGFSRLHPARPDLVTFSAIVGVPPELVDDSARAAVDMQDATQRDAYYDTLLHDPRMQQQIDPATKVGSGTGALIPSCTRALADGSVDKAFPPRRIVETAKSFGANAVVQSICQDDLAPAMKPIFTTMADHLGEQCLPFHLLRDHDGRVPCDVIWELPAQASLGNGTPIACSDLPFLANVSGSRKATNERGGNNCVVKQLVVANPAADASGVESGEGWYYDNFTRETAVVCQPGRLHRIAFTPSAKPPVDVHVVLDCDAHADVVE